MYCEHVVIFWASRGFYAHFSVGYDISLPSDTHFFQLKSKMPNIGYRQRCSLRVVVVFPMYKEEHLLPTLSPKNMLLLLYVML